MSHVNFSRIKFDFWPHFRTVLSVLVNLFVILSHLVPGSSGLAALIHHRPGKGVFPPMVYRYRVTKFACKKKNEKQGTQHIFSFPGCKKCARENQASKL